MAIIDIFNGDADGICSLVQLRNADPQDSELITGVKRDIALANRVKFASGDEVTILDVSFDKNREGVVAALNAGANVRYFDHHFAGEIPMHERLQTHINTAPDICTSLLVNGYLKGKYRAWAVVGAFGDNLSKSAAACAAPLALSESDVGKLEALGRYLNYNGYGANIADLHFPPAELYRRVANFTGPLDFIEGDAETFSALEEGYHGDLTKAQQLKPYRSSEQSEIYILPGKAWALRVRGVFGNQLANGNPDQAHAVLIEMDDDNFLVSVRAPLSNKTGADEICRKFPTGGGRKAAAGINSLPREMLDQFVQTLDNYYLA